MSANSYIYESSVTFLRLSKAIHFAIPFLTFLSSLILVLCCAVISGKNWHFRRKLPIWQAEAASYLCNKCWDFLYAFGFLIQLFFSFFHGKSIDFPGFVQNKRALSTGEPCTCEYVTLLQSFHRCTLSKHLYIVQNF